MFKILLFFQTGVALYILGALGKDSHSMDLLPKEDVKILSFNTNTHTHSCTHSL